jgi:hypothetical protein
MRLTLHCFFFVRLMIFGEIFWFMFLLLIDFADDGIIVVVG